MNLTTQSGQESNSTQQSSDQMNLESHQKQASSKQQQHRAAKLHHHPWHFKTNQDNSLIDWPLSPSTLMTKQGYFRKKKTVGPGLFPSTDLPPVLTSQGQHQLRVDRVLTRAKSGRLGRLSTQSQIWVKTQLNSVLGHREEGRERERERYVPAFHESTTTVLLLRRRLSVLRSISRRILLGISLRRRISLLGISLRGISRRRISVFGISLRWIT